MPKILRLSGTTYGRLKILKPSMSVNSSNTSYWVARCLCGSWTIVSYAYLQAGKREHKSCGCARALYMLRSRKENRAQRTTYQKELEHSNRVRGSVRRWSDDKQRAKHGKRMREAFVEHNTAEKLAANSKATWKDPTIRKRRVEGLRKAAKTHPNRSVEGRARFSAIRKKLVLDPEHLRRASLAQKLSYKQDPGRRQRLIATSNRSENVARSSRLCQSQVGRKSGPESLLETAVNRPWFQYTGDNSRIGKQPISADFVIKDLKFLVQVDGCYWHCCKLHGRKPNSLFARNKRRKDRRLTLFAEAAGWTVLRFWEHEIQQDIQSVVATIKQIRLSLRRGR